MKRWLLIAGAVLLAAIAGLTVWQQTSRVHFIQTLCEAGLPNLSRPPVIEADRLGCTVLGPKQTLTGYVSTAFEHSSLTVGAEVVTGRHGFENDSAWFSGTDGLDQRGGEDLNKVLEIRRPGLCGSRLAKVTVEGWMTASPGGFGHLNLADHEFYAYRIVSANAPSTAELVPFQYGTAPDWPAETVAFCKDRERPDFEGL